MTFTLEGEKAVVDRAAELLIIGRDAPLHRFKIEQHLDILDDNWQVINPEYVVAAVQAEDERRRNDHDRFRSSRCESFSPHSNGLSNMCELPPGHDGMHKGRGDTW